MSDSAFDPGSDEEWEVVMHQLRLQPKAEPHPFFYGRVRARLLARANASATLLPAWLRRPVYTAVLGALVLIVSGDGSVVAPATSDHGTNHPAQALSH